MTLVFIRIALTLRPPPPILPHPRAHALRWEEGRGAREAAKEATRAGRVSGTRSGGEARGLQGMVAILACLVLL